MEKRKTSLWMNKNFLIGMIVLLVLVLVSLVGYIGVDAYQAYREKEKIMEGFREYLKRDGLSIIYVESSTCEFCALQTPILERVAKDYDLEYYQVDISKLDKESLNEILTTLDIDKGTPRTVILDDGKVTYHIDGYFEGYKFVEMLIKANVLDETATYIPEENLTFIDYDQFEELRKSKEPVAVAMGTSVCEFCRSAKPIMSNVAKAYDIPIYYLVLNSLSTEKQKAVKSELAEMDFKEDFGTPTIFVLKENKVVSTLSGLQNVTTYVQYFKEQKIIH